MLKSYTHNCVVKSYTRDCVVKSYTRDCVVKSYTRDYVVKSYTRDYVVKSYTRDCVVKSYTRDCVVKSYTRDCVVKSYTRDCVVKSYTRDYVVKSYTRDCVVKGKLNLLNPSGKKKNHSFTRRKNFSLIQLKTHLQMTVSMKFNPLLHRYSFCTINNRHLLETLLEKEKSLVMSNFSFSHKVFYSIR